jgi:hypothetical protein
MLAVRKVVAGSSQLLDEPGLLCPTGQDHIPLREQRFVACSKTDG